jgi:hypothetical protein
VVERKMGCRAGRKEGRKRIEGVRIKVEGKRIGAGRKYEHCEDE